MPAGQRPRATLMPPPTRLAPTRARAAASVAWWRRASAAMRPLPDVVIVGTQRGGTTSLFNWLSMHPEVSPAFTKEVHFFDRHFDNGAAWYRSHFPLRRSAVTLEATPYLLFHPLAPERAARTLPSARFVVLLREPAQRAVSHYWHSRRIGAEDEPLPVALAREEERLAGQEAVVRAGRESFAYRNFSYRARGRYAEQLARWFAAVGEARVLVMESEELFDDPAGPGRVLAWLGLAPHDRPFPATNEAPRSGGDEAAALAELEAYFAPHNEELFARLGRRLWGR